MSGAVSESVFQKLLGRYLAAAWAEIETPKGKYPDAEMSAALAAYRAADVAEVVRDEAAAVLACWINAYKIARAPWTNVAGNRQDSLAYHVASTALDLFARRTGALPPMREDFVTLRHAIGALYHKRMGKERQFTSMTAKVLWCFRPDDAPIFDDYAYRAVTTLIKLDKALTYPESYDQAKDIVISTSKKDREWAQTTQAEKDIWWFGEFAASHARLFTLCQPVLQAYIAGKGKVLAHVNAYRLFDKFLWLYGNSQVDFNVESQAERTNKT